MIGVLTLIVKDSNTSSELYNMNEPRGKHEANSGKEGKPKKGNIQFVCGGDQQDNCCSNCCVMPRMAAISFIMCHGAEDASTSWSE